MGVVKASYNESPADRLKLTQTNFVELRNSGGPELTRLIGPKFLTLLPSCILKQILSSNRIGTGIIFSSIPGSTEKTSVGILGKRIRNMIPIIGPQYAQTG